MDKFKLAMEIVKQIGYILAEPLGAAEIQRQLEMLRTECLVFWHRKSESELRATLDVVCSMEVA